MTKPTQLYVAQITSWALLGLLLVSFCIWQWVRPGGVSPLFWAVQCVPLLILLPGLKRDNSRSYIWLCFLMLAYFVKGVDGVVFPSRAWIDYLMLVVSVVLFISAMLAARWLHQYHLATAHSRAATT